MIGAIVLAAGASRRFGRSPKLLAPLHGKPLLAHALMPLAAAGVRTVVLVTGASRSRVARVARLHAPASLRLRIVCNTRYRHGMASSMQRGLGALPSHCDAALICLGDMPAIDARLLRRLRTAWQPGLDCVRPVHAGIAGHPVLISRNLFTPIQALDGDQGARSVLAQVSPARRRLIKADANSVADIDTPATFRAYRRRRPAAIARTNINRPCVPARQSFML